MQGLHLTADLYDCDCDAALLITADALSKVCREQTLESGLTLVAEKWHTFPDFNDEPGGVTGMLLLAESHLAVHTWPERKGVTLDVYVCNFQDDNSTKAERLMHSLLDAFQPGKAQSERLLRGDEEGTHANGELVLESLNATSLYGFRFNRRLATEQTPFQRLEVLESAELGRCLRLDDHFMTAEREEFFYHEALIHPAAVAHPKPRSALIIGGGDGGALEELLKHNTIERATLVELDGQVIEASKRHLQSIHKDSFDDARVTVRIEDGCKFLQETGETFDLVMLDLTDPETPAGPLYTAEFFRHCQRVMAPGAALVLHLGSPFHEPEQVRQLAATLSGVFAQVNGLGLHIPLYGSYWALAVASDTLNPLDTNAATVQKRLHERGVDGLQYYNEQVHSALFALPNFYRALMPAGTAA